MKGPLFNAMLSARLTLRPERRLPARSLGVPLLVTALLCIGYLIWAPTAPDLLAQVARAGVAARAGSVGWWTGWFGGLSLPSYSVLVPSWMATVGIQVTGVAAVAASAAGGALLMRDAPRPRAGAVAFAVASIADLVAGRVTFAVGLAIGIWALVALRSRRQLLSVGLGAAAYLASPLAGLFLGLILLAVISSDSARRRVAVISAAVLVLLGGTMAILFPGTGVMPISVLDLIPPGVACAAVAVVCPTPIVRRSAVFALLAMPVVLLFPGAIGTNITRLAWVGAVPVVIGYAKLSRRWLAAVGVLVAIWPVADLVEQLQTSVDPSTRAAFYQPLADAIHRAQATAGPEAIGERVEAIDTASHGASAYLAPSFALARGWDRQADRAYNALFYSTKSLTADSYHAWLHELAVGWVALPKAPLDYSAAAEGALVRAGLPYLRAVWGSADWTLYEVTDAAPLASGAQVLSVADSSVTLATTTAATAAVQIRWSPYLTVIDPGTQRPDPTACIVDDGGWIRVYLPREGAFQLVSRFEIDARWRTDVGSCPAT